ncbi:MAG: phage holin family protein, partial [Pseudoxanthomonas sp.]
MSEHASERERPDEPGDEAAPHLDESVRRIGASGKAALDSAKDTGRALRSLVSADLALARSALGRALAWVAVGIVFGASAWLLVIAALIAVLQRLGWSWLQSLSFAAALSIAVTAVAVWRTILYFDRAGMHATRRQLSRLGIGDEG